MSDDDIKSLLARYDERLKVLEKKSEKIEANYTKGFWAIGLLVLNEAFKRLSQGGF